jgi:hypothetical protein
MKHRNVVTTWLGSEGGLFYSAYLQEALKKLLGELVNQYVTDKGVDISMVIRGRINMLEDLLMLPEIIKSYEGLKRELSILEAEGYKE